MSMEEDLFFEVKKTDYCMIPGCDACDFWNRVPIHSDHWSVHLPMEGMPYVVAGYDIQGVEHSRAVQELKEFIEQAQMALILLETRSPNVRYFGRGGR